MRRRLGLLSPSIVEAIKRRKENKLGQAAIISELSDLGHKLALAAHYVHMHQGTVDRSQLEALASHLQGYSGLRDLVGLSASIERQLSMSDTELQSFIRLTAEASGKGVALQKYPVPLLDARVSAIWSFATDVQRRLLDIRTRVELLNDLVDRSRNLHDLTFSKLEGDNYKLVVESIEQCYSQYARGASIIVEHIEKLRHTP